MKSLAALAHEVGALRLMKRSRPDPPFRPHSFLHQRSGFIASSAPSGAASLKNPDAIGIGIFLGGDYWTRTSGLMRVKHALGKTGEDRGTVLLSFVSL